MRNREGHFGAVSQERVDASASINEGGTAEDFKSFRPLLNSEETGAFLVSIRPLQDILVVLSEIRQRLISHRVKGIIPLQGVGQSPTETKAKEVLPMPGRAARRISSEP